MEAIIVGAGIGGLTAAASMEQRGIRYRVFEQSTELREVGAGLTLWPNACRVLRQLGLLDHVVDQGALLERAEIRREDGKILVANRPTDGADAPMVAIHRAALHAALLGALPEDAIQLGCRLVRYEEAGDGVVAHFRDETVARGDVLVGADGLRSVVRALIHGEHPPNYAGYVAWRGVAGLRPPHAGLAVETWGRGARFGMVPISNNSVYWYATANEPEGSTDEAGERVRQLMRRFGHWHRPIREVIEATPEDRILRNEIADRDPVPSWGLGPATLLGDAAHPMTPNLGQGACTAIEDAFVLARCLSRTDSAVGALRRYEEIRQERTDWIVGRSRQIGRMGQLENPAAVWLRNLLIRHAPARLNQRVLDRVAGYDATSAE
jgi:2-polyprenyl-6-methoxyphenol hydroxylase-like FAD-dependent oxidoreductase